MIDVYLERTAIIASPTFSMFGLEDFFSSLDTMVDHSIITRLQTVFGVSHYRIIIIREGELEGHSAYSVLCCVVFHSSQFKLSHTLILQIMTSSCHALNCCI